MIGLLSNRLLTVQSKDFYSFGLRLTQFASGCQLLRRIYLHRIAGPVVRGDKRYVGRLALRKILIDVSAEISTKGNFGSSYANVLGETLDTAGKVFFL